MASWRELISKTMKKNGDDWSNLISITLSDYELNRVFDNGYGGKEGKPFTAWTTDFVYFPICYDGLEWCGSAPRNPNGVALTHQGG